MKTKGVIKNLKFFSNLKMVTVKIFLGISLGLLCQPSILDDALCREVK